MSQKKPSGSQPNKGVEALSQSLATLTTDDKLKCCLANVHSVNDIDKWEDMCTKVIEEDFDIVFITESWLKENVGNRMDQLGEAYELFRKDRPIRRGGGVLCIVKTGLLEEQQLIVPDRHIEHFCDVLILDHGRLETRFVLIYRPPNTSAPRSQSLIQQVIKNMKEGWNNVIIGDLNYAYTPAAWDRKYNNINWANNNRKGGRLRYFFERCRLKQLVTFPTNVYKDKTSQLMVSKNTLDVIIATEIVVQDVNDENINYFVRSDHHAISFDVLTAIRAGGMSSSCPQPHPPNVDPDNFAVIQAVENIGNRTVQYETFLETILERCTVDYLEIYPQDNKHFRRTIFIEFRDKINCDTFVTGLSGMDSDDKLFKKFKKPDVQKYSTWNEKDEE